MCPSVSYSDVSETPGGGLDTSRPMRGGRGEMAGGYGLPAEQYEEPSRHRFCYCHGKPCNCDCRRQPMCPCGAKCQLHCLCEQNPIDRLVRRRLFAVGGGARHVRMLMAQFAKALERRRRAAGAG